MSSLLGEIGGWNRSSGWLETIYYDYCAVHNDATRTCMTLAGFFIFGGSIWQRSKLPSPSDYDLCLNVCKRQPLYDDLELQHFEAAIAPVY